MNKFSGERKRHEQTVPEIIISVANGVTAPVTKDICSACGKNEESIQRKKNKGIVVFYGRFVPEQSCFFGSKNRNPLQVR